MTAAAALGLLFAAPRVRGDSICELRDFAGRPVPTRQSVDPVVAQLAKARAAEIERAALALESTSFTDSRSLWRWLLCVDPGSDAAKAGLFRTGPLAVVPPFNPDVPTTAGKRPSAGTAGIRAPAPWLTLATALPELAPAVANVSAPPPDLEPAPANATASAPPELAPAAASATASPPPELAPGVARATGSGPPEPLPLAPQTSSLDREIDDIETLVWEAQFRSALGVAASTAAALDAAEEPRQSPRRARLALLQATAEVALGRIEAARTHMGVALAAEPELELDPQSTSPKVLSLLAELRSDTPPAAASAP